MHQGPDHPLVVAVVTCLVVLCSGIEIGWAHQTDEAEHHAEVRADEGEVEQLLSISAEDLAHHLGHIGHGQEPSRSLLDEIRDDVGEYLDDQTGVRADEELCELEETEFVYYPAGDGRIHYRQLWDCIEDAHVIELANRIMVDSHDGYRHTGRIDVDGDLRMTVFDINYPTHTVYPSQGTEPAEEDSEPGPSTDEEPDRQVDEEAPEETSAESPESGELLWTGFVQVPLAPLHILFVLSLVFAVHRLRWFVVAIGCFVAASTATFFASNLGYWTASAWVVEVLIPFSVLWVAGKNSLNLDRWPRVWLISLTFGLVYGFAYAGLFEQHFQAVAGEPLAAMAMFKVGVELGHLAVVVLTYPAVAWLRRTRPKISLGFKRWFNLAFVLVTIYWLVHILVL